MGFDRLVSHVGFANKEIGFAPDIDERIGPLGVAGKADDLFLCLEAKAEAWPGAVVVHDVERRHPDRTDFRAPADLQLSQRQRKAQLHCLCTGKGCLHQFGKSRLESRWPGDDERALALENVDALENEERHAAHMVRVEMRNINDIDFVSLDGKLVQGNQRARPAIDQSVDSVSHQMEAGVEPSAGAKRIAAADELQMHVSSSA